jgi:large subunit ribosomal protein L25
MAEALRVEARLRETFGKNVARRLRSTGLVPGVIYGGGGPSLAIALDPRHISHLIRSEAGHTAILTLEVPGAEPARVMLKEWQMEPVYGHLLHVDFVRITRDTRVRLRVPIHITGEPQGVKVQGGIFEFVLREVEVECLPDDIPERITADVTDLMIGRNLRVENLPVAKGVTVLTDPDRVVAHVVALKIEEEKPAEAVEVVPAEPELIRKPKGEEETGEEKAGEGGKGSKP